MTRASSPATPWVGLIRHVLDDDARTRRAERLLSLLTVWLVVVGAVVVMTAVLLLSGPWWASAGAGGVGVASILAAWLRRRFGLSAQEVAATTDAPATAVEQAANVVPIKKGGNE